MLLDQGYKLRYLTKLDLIDTLVYNLFDNKAIDKYEFLIISKVLDTLGDYDTI